VDRLLAALQSHRRMRSPRVKFCLLHLGHRPGCRHRFKDSASHLGQWIVRTGLVPVRFEGASETSTSKRSSHTLQHAVVVKIRRSLR
jgi:hypothetical protein